MNSLEIIVETRHTGRALLPLENLKIRQRMGARLSKETPGPKGILIASLSAQPSSLHHGCVCLTMSVSISTNRVVPQGAEPDEPSVDSHFGRASKPCSDEKQQKRTANCPIDRGNRRRMIRGAELVIRRPRPPRLAPTDEEEAAQRVAISPTGRVNADALTKKCVDELGDDSAIPTPSTSTDSPASSKEGSLNSSMLEYLLFELSSSSSASDHDTDEVLFDGFISDDDTPR